MSENKFLIESKETDSALSTSLTDILRKIDVLFYGKNQFNSNDFFYNDSNYSIYDIIAPFHKTNSIEDSFEDKADTLILNIISMTFFNSLYYYANNTDYNPSKPLKNNSPEILNIMDNITNSYVELLDKLNNIIDKYDLKSNIHNPKGSNIEDTLAQDLSSKLNKDIIKLHDNLKKQLDENIDSMNKEENKFYNMDKYSTAKKKGIYDIVLSSLQLLKHHDIQQAIEHFSYPPKSNDRITIYFSKSIGDSAEYISSNKALNKVKREEYNLLSTILSNIYTRLNKLKFR